MYENENRIANVLDEIGVYYKANSRVENLFKVKFFLPNDKVIVDIAEFADYVKTDNLKVDRIYNSKFIYKKRMLETLGYKFIDISYLDTIDKDTSYAEVSKIIKQNLKLDK